MLAGKAKYSSIFNYPTLTLGRHRRPSAGLVDGAAIMNQISRCAAVPNGPLRGAAMIRVARKKSFLTQRQGL